MNRMIQLKETTPVFLVAFLLCFWVLQRVQAVVPPPDGGYPGFNTAEGQNALLGLTTGQGNTAVGWLSLRGLTTGSFNTGVGAGTLALNNGERNTATGAGALLNNTTGIQNTANGAFALFSNTDGGTNTANGDFALFSNTTGTLNTAVGAIALANNTGGSGNIALGVDAGGGVTSANNVTCIGSHGANVDNSCFIDRIFGATSSGGTAVFINSGGRLGTVTSSRRFKEEIKPMDKASEALHALKPVTFRYKKGIDPEGIPQFGLVAEDVEAVNPDLVVRDKEGKVNTVRYEAVNAMLLNEFLKEHRTVQELKMTIAQQQKQIEALGAGLQKVSAQLAAASPSRGGLELSKFAVGRIRRGGLAPQTVKNTD